MSKIRHITVGGTIAAVLLLAVGAGVAEGFSFGDRKPGSPLLAVTAAATANGSRCSGLTPNKLAAYMLSIPWHELTGGITSMTPAPMALSRNDNQTNLYAFGQRGGPARRSFWSPGIGLWQADDTLGGLGTGNARGKFNAGYQAPRVADLIASRYCRGQNVFTPIWAACNGGTCQHTFNQLYPGNPVLKITGDNTVDNTGGSALRTCRFGGRLTGCTYVNPNRAQPLDQANSDYWRSFPNGRAPRDPLAPLAKPFYVITQAKGSQLYEWRVWIRPDTGYSTVSARRTFGQDSRTSLAWHSDVHMCDIATIPDRGDC